MATADETGPQGDDLADEVRWLSKPFLPRSNRVDLGIDRPGELERHDLVDTLIERVARSIELQLADYGVLSPDITFRRERVVARDGISSAWSTAVCVAGDEQTMEFIHDAMVDRHAPAVRAELDAAGCEHFAVFTWNDGALDWF